jgi:Ca2+-binding EF-hand superfamily protein
MTGTFYPSGKNEAVRAKASDNMKTMHLVLILCAAVLPTSAGPPNSPPADDPLAAKFDLNHNGKIDADEHREYVRALSRQRQQEAKTLAEQRPQLTPDERRFYHPPRPTPSLLPQYDTNHNGKLDLQERINIQNDAAEAARKEFRQYDVNANGKLDPDELKAARQAEQQKLERQVQKPKGTGPEIR